MTTDGVPSTSPAVGPGGGAATPVSRPVPHRSYGSQYTPGGTGAERSSAFRAFSAASSPEPPPYQMSHIVAMAASWGAAIAASYTAQPLPPPPSAPTPAAPAHFVRRSVRPTKRPLFYEAGSSERPIKRRLFCVAAPPGAAAAALKRRTSRNPKHFL